MSNQQQTFQTMLTRQAASFNQICGYTLDYEQGAKIGKEQRESKQPEQRSGLLVKLADFLARFILILKG